MFAMALLISQLFMSDAGQPQLDDVVARVGARTIKYRQIGCDPSMIPEAAAKTRGQTATEICHAAEQSALSRVVREYLIQAAARKYHVELTEAERLEAVPAKFRSPQQVSAITESRRLPAEAALRVLHGEDKEKVFQDALSDAALAKRGLQDIHFNATVLDDALRFFRTERDVTVRLEALSDKRTLSELVDYFSGGLLARRVRDLLLKRAAISNEELSAIQERFWKEILAEQPLVIVDPHYTMPVLKELV